MIPLLSTFAEKKNSKKYLVFFVVQNGDRRPSWIWLQNLNSMAEMKSGGSKPSENIYFNTFYDLQISHMRYFIFSIWPPAAILDCRKYLNLSLGLQFYSVIKFLVIKTVITPISTDNKLNIRFFVFLAIQDGRGSHLENGQISWRPFFS